MLFDRWCLSKNVNKDYVQLHQLVLIKEFKNCLPMELKTYIDEQKVENLHQAAVLADDYALLHKSVFKHSGELPPRTYPENSSATAQTSNGSSKTPGRTSSDPPLIRSQQLAAGPTCFCSRPCNGRM